MLRVRVSYFFQRRGKSGCFRKPVFCPRLKMQLFSRLASVLSGKNTRKLLIPGADGAKPPDNRAELVRLREDYLKGRRSDADQGGPYVNLRADQRIFPGYTIRRRIEKKRTRMVRVRLYLITKPNTYTVSRPMAAIRFGYPGSGKIDDCRPAAERQSAEDNQKNTRPV
jgi:hypothetical protein